MAYLASPYSSPSRLERWRRWYGAVRAVAHLMGLGEHVYSPIVHCHWPACLGGLPGDFEFWRAYNADMLRRSDALIVLKLRGWESSDGIQGEIAMAKIWGTPIAWLVPPA